MPKKSPQSPYERWLDQAKEVAQAENPLRMPYDVFLKEAGQVAGFVGARWEPSESLPGLRRVRARLPASTADEILSLVHAVQAAQTRLLLLTDPVVIDHGERARFLIDELESAIEFLLDDGVEEPADTQLATIQAFHADSAQRSSALHQALSDYAGLAESLKDRLVEIDEAFDAALIDEARELARTLSTAPAALPRPDADVKGAMRIRNGMLVLLANKVGLVRKAAARVFQRHPEILREVTSTYERRRRAAARRAKAQQQATPKAPPGPGAGGAAVPEAG
ncbi:uncharacterized protein SOCEGT47_011590 [Sorangium cellulosum]|uniref:Uncharacterized protein n=1 Tax=Sorangium cellulosum TaxID=56 RepID=A0A4P2PW30_SORCE|nr:hypothetical protein [Sorangium cellulosum]AUX20686.1 uncharacterized protein SOCEGT47_011590 [Sorangium cellulosum]